MEAKFDQSLHEKLCAYVLGDCEGADRAEVERELLRSPELRAEKERLERTIGAVRGALEPAETLNPVAHAALERAVRPAKIVQFPWLRMAAGIGAIGLGWWVLQGPTRDRNAFDQQVAKLSESRENALELRQDAPAASKPDERARLAAAASPKEQPHQEGQLDPVGFRDEIVGKLEKGKTIEPEGAPASASAGVADGNALIAGVPARIAAEPPADTLVFDSAKRWREVSKSGDAKDPTLAGLERGEAQVVFEIGAAPLPMPVQGAQPDALTARAITVSQSAGASGPSTAGPTPGGGGGGGVGPATGGPGVRSGTPLHGAPSLSLSTVQAPGSKEVDGYRGPGDTLPPSSPGLTAPPGEKDARLVAARLAGEDKFEAVSHLGYASDDRDEEVRRQAKNWHQMTPHEQNQYLDWRCGTIVTECTPRPYERPRDMFFRFYGDNPFEVAALDKLSTFSIDVDTASYALARRYLNEGKVPEKAQVRTEEFVNYFRPDISAPVRSTFAVHTDLTPSRFSVDAARQMLRVVVRAKDVDKLERQPLRLTFVVDVSGSMKEQNRLETVKHALRLLVAQLEPRDSIALVKFSNDASLVLPMTPVLDRAAIENVIAPLVPEGSTNSNAGLQLGYAQALTDLDVGAINRVVFLSDGVANVGETDAARIIEGVKSIREKGIFLNTVGVGMNNHNDTLLEQLANKGDGMCNYVDSPKEIQRALVDRFTGAFQPIARDVKIQVEFDADQVMRYRLLGYENRAIADADFRNDAVDAGEIGAGHQVTALYEIEPTGRTSEKPMATVRVRWKPIVNAGAKPESDSATEAAFDVSAKSYQAYESSPAGHRRALIVAQFAEILRRSIHARGDSLDDLIRGADLLQKQMPGDADFAEFTALLLRSKELVLRTLPACDDLCRTIDLLRTNRYLGATAHEMGRDARTLEEIERTTRDLELRLRELLRQQADKTESGLKVR